jgi:uncharacterized repeat protein (TIGR03803 family)
MTPSKATSVLQAVLLAVAMHAASAASFKTLYDFKGRTDGAEPFAELTAVAGMLYGTTTDAGPHHGGTLFSFDPATASKTTLAGFAGGRHGRAPDTPLIERGGKLWGTLVEAGSKACFAGCGVAFSYDLASAKERTLYAFQGGGDGQTPFGGLTTLGGLYYGTTTYGGGTNCLFGAGCGTVFALDPRTRSETVLYRFKSANDAQNPGGALTLVDGVFYGTSSNGPDKACVGAGCGTLYTIDPATGAETEVYRFAGGADGSNPNSHLLRHGHDLYGTTQFGGTGGCTNDGAVEGGCGTLFRFDLTTGAETVLHSFHGGTDGQGPSANLLRWQDGAIYGTTAMGGDSACLSGCGTIYSVEALTGAETVLWRFKGGQGGSFPGAGLTWLNGVFYGTTSDYLLGHGTLFALTP